MLSQELHIEVIENGVPKVRLKLGPRALPNLSSLMPGFVRAKLAARNINLEELAARAQATDYAPGNLFTLADGVRTVRVWLA